MWKIVETLEKGKLHLTVIPYQWEVNGKLFWPRAKSDTLINDSNSVPGEKWFEMSCKLK